MDKQRSSILQDMLTPDHKLDPWRVLKTQDPLQIEAKSMETIQKLCDLSAWSKAEQAVVMRCIHTSADFDYATQLRMTSDAVLHAVELIRRGAHIVTDTTMAMSGINRRVLETFGGAVHCFIQDDLVAKQAKERGQTRSTISMEVAYALQEKQQVPFIYAIGNAPTALLRLAEGIYNEGWRPDFIIGVPVGFVNVVESKELIRALPVPSIVAMGRKGGSNIAAAICNALIYQASGRQVSV